MVSISFLVLGLLGFAFAAAIFLEAWRREVHNLRQRRAEEEAAEAERQRVQAERKRNPWFW